MCSHFENLQIKMHSIIFLSFLLAVSNAQTIELPEYSNYEASSPRIFEPLINATFEKIKSYLAKIDPLDLDSANFTIPDGEVRVEKVHMEGLSNYRLENLKIDGLITYWLHTDVVIPKASISIEKYAIDGKALYGHGKLNYEVEDLRCYLKLHVHPVLLVVNDVEVKPSIGKAKFEITGLYDDEKRSKEISDAINHFLNVTLNTDKELHRKLSKIVEKVVQKVLDMIKKRPHIN